MHNGLAIVMWKFFAEPLIKSDPVKSPHTAKLLQSVTFAVQHGTSVSYTT